MERFIYNHNPSSNNRTQKDPAIHISQVDLTIGRTLTAPVVIRSRLHGIAEGSHIIKRGRYYYFFTAEGRTESGH
jgi:beta-xylosidase